MPKVRLPPLVTLNTSVTPVVVIDTSEAASRVTLPVIVRACVTVIAVSPFAIACWSASNVDTLVAAKEVTLTDVSIMAEATAADSRVLRFFLIFFMSSLKNFR